MCHWAWPLPSKTALSQLVPAEWDCDIVVVTEHCMHVCKLALRPPRVHIAMILWLCCPVRVGRVTSCCTVVCGLIANFGNLLATHVRTVGQSDAHSERTGRMLVSDAEWVGGKGLGEVSTQN